MKLLRHIAILVAALLSLTSCQEAEAVYSSRPVYFAYVGTNTVPQLNKALSSLGQYCTITVTPTHYVFTSTTGHDQTNREAIQDYRNFRLGLAGLIVGLPTIPELGADQSHVVCYDLACPNCYNDYTLSKAMVLKENGRAECGNCHRAYDLNNQGLVVAGTAGHSLFRYRVTYIPYTLRVVNQ